jgi:hypothetical protein
VGEVGELIRSYIIRSTMLISLSFIAHMSFRGRGFVWGDRVRGARNWNTWSRIPRAGDSLFDHLVSLGEQQNWNLKAEGVSGLEIDHQLYLGALLDWEVYRLGALENFSDVDPCLLM